MLPVATQQFLGATFTSGCPFPFSQFSESVDITYFFSLIGINAVFTISSVLFTVNLLSCIAGFALIEVRLVNIVIDADARSLVVVKCSSLALHSSRFSVWVLE